MPEFVFGEKVPPRSVCYGGHGVVGLVGEGGRGAFTTVKASIYDLQPSFQDLQAQTVVAGEGRAVLRLPEVGGAGRCSSLCSARRCAVNPS